MNRLDVAREKIARAGEMMGQQGVDAWVFYARNGQDPSFELMFGRAARLETLVLLTAVPGLMAKFPEESSLIAHLSTVQLEGALEAAQGRMKKKVLGAQEALAAGVGQVIIADGRIAAPISSALSGKGTVIA